MQRCQALPHDMGHSRLTGVRHQGRGVGDVQAVSSEHALQLHGGCAEMHRHRAPLCRHRPGAAVGVKIHPLRVSTEISGQGTVCADLQASRAALEGHCQLESVLESVGSLQRADGGRTSEFEMARKQEAGGRPGSSLQARILLRHILPRRFTAHRRWRGRLRRTRRGGWGGRRRRGSRGATAVAQVQRGDRCAGVQRHSWRPAKCTR